MDLALVQFHNPCYGSIAKACAKYFQDSTLNRLILKQNSELTSFC